MTVVLSSPPFYTTYIQLATGETMAPEIIRNTKFFPYFAHAIGAIDGSHIHISPLSHLRPNYRNHKGFVSQNCLFVCGFDMKFSYTLTGWEGSATDARIYQDAISTDLHIPQGKYLLGDAGFPLRLGLLVPYQGVHYHLAEWGRANLR